MAYHHLGGWLPLSALCASRAVKAWYKTHYASDLPALAALMSDRVAWVHDLRRRLEEEISNAQVCGSQTAALSMRKARICYSTPI